MGRTILSSRLVAFLALTVFVAVRAAQSAPQSGSTAATLESTGVTGFGNSNSITEEELKIYLYFLASDQLEGRNLPSRGYDTAALYVASHLAEWGLKPGGSTSQTNGPLQPYFMPIELVSKQVSPEETRASILLPAGGGRGGRGAASSGPRPIALDYGKDWTVFAGGRGAPPLEQFSVSGNLVFAGNGYVVNKTNLNPYAGLDVKGKIVVVAGLPPELAAQQVSGGGRGGRGGGAARNPLGESCTDFLTPAQAAAENGALAVVTIANFEQLSTMTSPAARSGGFSGFGGGEGGGGGRAPSLNGPAFQPPKLRRPPPCPAVPSVTAALGMTNAIFEGEKMSASQIFYAVGSNARQDSFELSEEKKLSLHVALRSEPGHGENVIGILEGGDPVLKDEYVVLSAHLDHNGLVTPLPDGHNVMNGADDDGSGCAGLLGIARAYAQGAAKGQRPKRSIVFLWNAGEEKGLWGSQYFSQYPPIDLSKVVANLNMDMIGRTKGPGYYDPDPTHALVNPGEIFVVGPNISSDDLEKTLETVNDSYQKLVLDHFYDTTTPDGSHDNLGPQTRGQRIFYRSDHYNFAKMGIPIAFFTDGLHPDYHRATDTAEKIDYKEIQVVSKTVAAVAWVLGNQAGRPGLNTNLPDQLVKDMKTVKDQGWGKLTPVLSPLPGEPY